MFVNFFPPQYSGAAKQAIALAKKLSILNHHIEFATVLDPGLPAFEMRDGFPVHRIEINGKRNQELPFWPNFLKFALKHKKRFDILHNHGAHYINSVIGPIAKTMGWKSLVKSTMSNNDLFGLKKSASGILHYLFLRTVNAYIAISSDLVKEFKTYGFKEKHIHYIPNGVDTNRFKPAGFSQKNELRKRFNLPIDKRIFLSVGVFDRRKNIGWLIEQWNKTKSFGTDNFLLAIGPQSRDDENGEFLSHLKGIASRNRQNMMLLSHVENIEEYYKASDGFLLTSTNEGMPNVVLEAMSSGLPCIATRTSGTLDLIEEGVTGFLFQQDNGMQLSEILKASNDPGFNGMGQKARETVLNKFSLDTVAKRYSNLYERMMRDF